MPLVADDASLADGLWPRLELRLHQHGEPGVRRGERQRCRQRFDEADEAHIGGDGPDRLWNDVVIERARVGLLKRDHARIGAKLGMQLAASDFHGKDPLGAAFQQYFREAPGRGAEVERDAAGWVEAEGVERGGELQSGAGNIGQGIALNSERRVRREQHSGFLRDDAADPHRSEADEVCRARARGGEPPFHDNSVEPHFFVDGHSSISYARPRVLRFSRARVEPGADGTPTSYCEAYPLGAQSRRSREPRSYGLPYR